MNDELDLNSMVDSIASDISSGQSTGELSGREPPPSSPAVEQPSGESAPPTTASEQGSESEPAPAAAPAKESIAAPRTWRPEAAAVWETLPDNVKQEVLKREEDMFKGIEQYKAQAGQAQPLLEAIKPYMPILQQNRIDPAVMVKNLLNAQYMLTTGSPAQKTAMLQKLARDYGVDWGADSQMIDPAINQIDQRIARIESQYTQDIHQRTMREVETFASELGKDGKPLRPYFDDVADDIVGLINSGQATDLQTAYDKAIWLNPVTRGKEIERAKAAEAAAAKKAAEEARKAEAANVKTSAKAVAANTPTGSMDDTLMDTLRTIKSRAS